MAPLIVTLRHECSSVSGPVDSKANTQEDSSSYWDWTTDATLMSNIDNVSSEDYWAESASNTCDTISKSMETLSSSQQQPQDCKSCSSRHHNGARLSSTEQKDYWNEECYDKTTPSESYWYY